jgi:hypothetical protein
MSGLLDILQGASNAAASNVSGPVDGIAWLLRKMGVPVQQPVGGSDWMASKGLTAQPKSQAMGLLGEALGMSAPIAAAAKAPQIARGLLAAGANAAVPRTMNTQRGAIVYHGSPHKFDAFDSSKIGTGEGAQAYGHGMYFAESPDVAKGYATTLANRDSTGYLTAHKNAQDLVARFKGDPEWAAEVVSDQLANLPKTDPNFARLTDTLAAIKSGTYARPLENPGNLYKVDLPDEQIAKMLDWDKPLSQQPGAIEALERAGVFTGRKPMGPVGEQWEAMIGPGGVYVNPNDPAQRAYIAAQQALGAGSASETFRKAGIPGIRYLDGGSRGAGSGTSNYVVFPGEEGLLKILERK